MQVFGFVFGIAIVALAAWVFFDATDRGKPRAWGWGLAFLVLGGMLFPLLVLVPSYAYARSRHQVEVAPGAPTRLYLVTAVFSSLVLAVVGASTAIAETLLWTFNSLGSNEYRDLLASALSATIVGAALWWPHWRAINNRLSSQPDDVQFRAMYALRRTELLTAAFAFGAVATVSALWLLGGAVSALLHTTYAAAAGWAPQVGPFVCAGLAAWYHGRIYKSEMTSDLYERFEQIPVPMVPVPVLPQAGSPIAQDVWVPTEAAIPAAQPAPVSAVPMPAVPVPATPPAAVRPPVAVIPEQASYCGACGRPVQSGDAFCRACGASVRNTSSFASPAKAG